VTSSGNNLTSNTANGNHNSGIYLENSEYNNLTRNTADLNTNVGINLFASSHNNLTGNTAGGNDWGLVLEQLSNDNTITGTSVLNNAAGAAIDNSHDNVLLGTIANSNSYSGITLLNGSENNQIIGGSASANGNGTGISLENVRNNLVSGVTVNNNMASFGIYLNQSDDNTLTANTAASNEYGIGLDNSSHNNLTGNAAPGNYFGISIYSGSDQNTLTNNSANSNTIGVYLYESRQNNLTSTTANDNSIGIYAITSDNTTITGGHVEGNGWGIYLDNSSGGDLTGVALTGNPVGIGLDHADNNVIAHNWVNSSSSVGLNIVSSTSNLVYDNYLFNDYNVNPDATSGNTWNITKTYGTNIIGGSYLGGNFYGSPDGYGFSQTTDSTDGIANYPFNIAPGNTDQLPLAIYPPGPERPPVPDPTPPPVPSPNPWNPEPVIPVIPPIPVGPAVVVAETIPTSAEPGETVNMAVTIKNNQDVSWGPDDYVTMQVWMTDPNGIVVSQVLNIQVSDGTTVKPGQNYKFSFDLQMPSQSGKDKLNMQLWKYVGGKWVKLGLIITNPITVGGEESKAGHLTNTGVSPRYITPGTSTLIPARVPANNMAGKLDSISGKTAAGDLKEQARSYTTIRVSSTRDLVYDLNKTHYGTEKYYNGDLSTTTSQNFADRWNVP